MYYGQFKQGHWGFGVFANRFISYVEIDDDEHMAMVEKANNEGKIFTHDEKGYPILIDPPPPSQEEINKNILRQSTTYLNITDWYVIRYIETGKEIPVDVKVKRQNARDAISRLKNI